MSEPTRPAVLLSDLLAGDGPHSELADDFLSAVCVACGGDVGRRGRVENEGWWCPTCWALRASEESHTRITPARP